jgi:hypothetical protein
MIGAPVAPRSAINLNWALDQGFEMTNVLALDDDVNDVVALT